MVSRCLTSGKGRGAKGLLGFRMDLGRVEEEAELEMEEEEVSASEDIQ